MKMLAIAIAIAILATMSACSNAAKAKVGGWGEKHRVTLYSGGQKVGEWNTTGSVENEESSDGFYFQDAATGKLIRISGTTIIERLSLSKCNPSKGTK